MNSYEWLILANIAASCVMAGATVAAFAIGRKRGYDAGWSKCNYHINKILEQQVAARRDPATGRFRKVRT